MRRGFFEGQRGQTSIEIALLTGVIFIVFISAFPYVTEMNMMNKGVTAARDGATYAQTMLNMGYSSGDASLAQGERVHVDDISYFTQTEDLGNGETLQRVFIEVTVSGISNGTTANQIGDYSLQYIYYSFYGEWPNEPIAWVDVGDNRKFYVNVVCVDCP